MAVEGGVPLGGLAATDGEGLAAAAGFGGDGDQVKGAAHGTAHDERQFIDEFVLDGRRDTGAVGLKSAGRSSHFDLLGGLSQLEDGVHAHGGGGGDNRVLLQIALKTGEGDLNAVGAGREIGDAVFAGSGGYSLVDDVGVAVGDGDLGGGHGGPGGVGDDTGDGSAFALREEAEAGEGGA